MTRSVALLLVLVLVVAACGGEDSTTEETIEGFTARQVDRVWVFSHAPTGGMDALHAGRVTIEDGCLFVDGAVVVFHESMVQDGVELIGAVRNGDEISATIPGGGVSLAEGGSAEQFPQVVRDRCQTDTVWFGAEGVLEISG